MANILDRISINPVVCGGKPCIRGTRIWVSLVLDMLAAGTTEADLLTEYPQLTHDDVLAAIHTVAMLGRDCRRSSDSDRAAARAGKMDGCLLLLPD